MEQPPPRVLALVLADQVYHDDDSGKFFVLGTRSDIGARSFPWEHPSLSVYAVLVAGRGEIALRFQLVDVDEEREPVAIEDVEVTFPDPLTELSIVVSFNDVVFPEPGEYRLQLFASDEYLGERRFVVVMLENPNQP